MKLTNIKTGERLSMTYYLEVLSRSGELENQGFFQK